jgi:hypothetical protein
LEAVSLAILPQPWLFQWNQIEARSDLDRLQLVLSALPDEPLMRTLERRRGRGRNDYPVRAMWNALIAGIVFQHASVASLLRELRRNAHLRQVCGFPMHPGACAVPTDAAMSRFLEVLMERQGELLRLFHGILERLMEHLPGLGRRLAVDSKALRSFGRPVKDPAKREAGDRRRDNDASRGVKTYRGVREDGAAWERLKTWFGYKLHLLVDSTHELPLGFRITEAASGDSPELLPLVAEAEARHPALSRRSEELCADKAYDAGENKRLLYDQHGIKPIIDHHRCWKGEKTRPLVEGRADFFVYDEEGEVFCVCPASGKMRPLRFMGFEADRKALKYRCPAAAGGFRCAGRASCESRAAVGSFGRTVRVPLETDRRLFTPIARPSPAWRRAYARRSSVERVNGRLDTVLGFEQHTIRGKRKMETRLTLALVVMLAMALGRVLEGQADRLRSILSPVQSKAG